MSDQFEFAQADHVRQQQLATRPGWTYGSIEPCSCSAIVKTLRVWHAPSDGRISKKLCVECNSQWVEHCEG